MHLSCYMIIILVCVRYRIENQLIKKLRRAKCPRSVSYGALHF